ncbi:hypothetical protein VPH35_016714 [Triticum aestivum]|uniref:Uncharacterized protein n=1 Tax=Aegilops tauschii TaxID=37682 RepID=M8BV94_AEGTA
MARVFVSAAALAVAAGRAVARTASRAGKGPLLMGGGIITAYVYREHLRRLARRLFASTRGPHGAWWILCGQHGVVLPTVAESGPA